MPGAPIFPVTLRLDDLGTGVTYIGEASVGTAESAAAWRIKRMTETGADLDIKWADGVHAFTKVWANRASYTYS